MTNRGLTLGTAGHIDHGKTALVEALTGKNTDRLAEERRRGISIELGFAELVLPGGRSLSVVDVPGHERFVRTMVAGATGIDLFLLVVAADDGPMPQTHEHLAVMRALGIERGVVAITKSELASQDALSFLTEEMNALVPGAPVVPGSARTGEGLDALRAALRAVATEMGSEPARSVWPEPAILHVDRAFTLTGIGTVVTGTLRSGFISVGDRLAILAPGVEARVRSVQTHDRSVRTVGPGRRVALNLAGIRREEVKRGDVVATPGAAISPSFRLDVALRLESQATPVHGERVQIHCGTRDAAARLIELEPRLAQLRLESPLIARTGDRLVIRSIAPPVTLGGAVVIDPNPDRHGPSGTAQVRLMADGEPEELLAAAFSDRPERLRCRPVEWERHSLVGPALRRFTPQRWLEAAERVQAELAPQARNRAEPIAATELGATALAAHELLVADGMRPRAPAAIADALEISQEEAVAALNELTATNLAVKVKPRVFFDASVMERIREEIVATARASGSVSIAEVRDGLKTSRKHAQALLEHFGGELTIRRGDRHVLRRARRE